MTIHMGMGVTSYVKCERSIMRTSHSLFIDVVHQYICSARDLLILSVWNSMESVHHSVECLDVILPFILTGCMWWLRWSWRKQRDGREHMVKP